MKMIPLMAVAAIALVGCEKKQDNKAAEAPKTVEFNKPEAGSVAGSEAGTVMAGTEAGTVMAGTEAGTVMAGTEAAPTVAGTEAAPTVAGTEAGTVAAS